MYSSTTYVYVHLNNICLCTAQQHMFMYSSTTYVYVQLNNICLCTAQQFMFMDSSTIYVYGQLNNICLCTAQQYMFMDSSTICLWTAQQYMFMDSSTMYVYGQLNNLCLTSHLKWEVSLNSCSQCLLHRKLVGSQSPHGPGEEQKGIEPLPCSPYLSYYSDWACKGVELVKNKIF
jgi:hypothetical protein